MYHNYRKIDFFILTKSSNEKITDNTNNMIIRLNQNNHFYILPESLIDCYSKNGLFESNLIELSRTFCQKDKIFLDIGAHTGTYSIYLSKFAKHVHSFEPQKMTYYGLCGSVALSNIDNITCHNIGLGSNNQIGQLKLNIVSVDGGGSTLHNDNTQRILSTETITINTLDSFNLTDISFIKMDVEDNELNVLQGAIETLRKSNYPPILFECNNKNTNRGIELFNFLIYLNYNVSLYNSHNMYLAIHN
jgi:FkbM family methyltransferase